MKFHPLRADADKDWSRPARGAWIEIYCCGCKCCTLTVAPRTGRVD